MSSARKKSRRFYTWSRASRKKKESEQLDDALADLRAAEAQLEVFNLVHQLQSTKYVCEKCAGITLEGLTRPSTFSENREGHKSNNFDGGYYHYSKVRDLEISATVDRCTFCMMLWTAMRLEIGESTLRARFMPPWDKRPVRIEAEFFGSSISDSLTIHLGTDNTSEAHLGVLARKGSMASTMIETRPVPLDPLSDECLSTLHSWLHNCTTTHGCCGTGEPCRLPTRVIYVGHLAGYEDLRLITNTEPISPAAYVALSHCWGGIVPTRTTTKTLEEHEKKILFSELPKTFRDAIIITRKVGVQYLWIDSLCIVQDDTEDWTREAARMADIYKRSFLTISATSAENSREGLLVTRDPNATAVIELKLNKVPGATDEETMIVTYPELGLGYDLIGARGWTLQELLLASRIVHYTFSPRGGDRMMLWECQRGSYREDGLAVRYPGTKRLLVGDSIVEYTKTSEPYRNMDKSGKVKVIQSAVEKDSHPDKNVELFADPSQVGAGDLISRIRWRDVVSRFSQRQLTVASDALPALSGVAAHIANALEGKQTFLAGLWSGADLFHDLLWVVSFDANLRAASDRAPSWSWAAVDGEVFYHGCSAFYDQAVRRCVTSVCDGNPSSKAENGDGHELQDGATFCYSQHPFDAEVVGLHAEPENAGNPFGAVKPGAFIRISGMIMEVRGDWKQGDRGRHEIFHLSTPIVRETWTSGFARASFDTNAPAEQNVWCLLITSQCYYFTGYPGDKLNAHGLLLVPVVSEAKTRTDRAEMPGSLEEMREEQASEREDSQETERVFRRVGVFVVTEPWPLGSRPMYVQEAFEGVTQQVFKII